MRLFRLIYVMLDHREQHGPGDIFERTLPVRSVMYVALDQITGPHSRMSQRRGRHTAVAGCTFTPTGGSMLNGYSHTMGTILVAKMVPGLLKAQSLMATMAVSL